jgi:hypothetical protein
MNENEKINTEAFAGKLGVKSGTVRRGYCIDGHYMGVKPVKLPNRRLLWPAAEANKLTHSEAAQ